MFEFLKDALGGLLGGALAAGTGYWLFWSQRRTAAKDDFRATIDDLRAKLDTSRDKTQINLSRDKFDVFYNDSVDILRRAVDKVRRHLDGTSRARLQNTFQEYESHKQWFESPDKVALLITDLRSSGNPRPQMFLDSFLERFDACVR